MNKSDAKRVLNSLKIIKRGAESLRLRIELSPENDSIHQILEGMIQACQEEIAFVGSLAKPVDPAMRAVLSRHSNAVSANVAYYDTHKNQACRVGIPIHQCLQDQVDWCVRKGAGTISVLVKLSEGTSIFESFPARQLVGANFLA